jgi:type VI secretion system protein VasG
MAEISRLSLFGKLNSVAYKSIESATVFCKLRGNPYVELVHWIQQIVQLPDSDLHRIIKHFGLNVSTLSRDLTNALDALPRGASAIADFSSHIEDSIERGWVYGSLVYQDSSIRLAYLILGALKTRELRSVYFQLSAEFQKIKTDELAEDLIAIVSGSVEDRLPAQDGSQLAGTGGVPGEHNGAVSPAVMGKQQALKQFTTDLTEQARDGKLDPIIGRDDEIRQLIDILMRRRQNNPILTGEAGVGKTAVVEGFAHRIIKGDVPPALQGVQLKVLDIGLLQAGASMKGEFENRLKQVIEEVKASPTPIIMFIDETHTLIGAGGAAGTGDAANLLKPALARGELRTIGATTWAEYKKHIEKDPALTRRFQVVKVEEPSEEKAILMLRNISTMLEKHHHVEVLDEAISAAVRLSHRYIPARQLPDKAVSLLDTAAARVAVSQFATPSQLESTVQSIANLNKELSAMQQEEAIGLQHRQRIEAIHQQLTQLKTQQQELEAQWQKEKSLVDQLIALRKTLRASAESAESAEDDAADAELNKVAQAKLELADVMSQLEVLQSESPLIFPCCDEQAVAAVVADWTGIPVGRMVSDELNTVLHLTDVLNKRVIGQDHAMAMITRRIQTSRAGLDNPNKPIGVFMLCGPSGVGKTETAMALGEALYGGEQNVITINMSEFQEAHTVSTLKGAPPGYVGYGEGGILTEAVRRKPYSVVLLDEVEKAHPDVHEIFFQVFDKGIMEDGEGRLIDFKNTLILLTSNVGSELITNLCKDPELCPEPDEISKALRAPLLKVFPAALLGRIVTIPYYPLSDDMLGSIIRLQLNRIKKRIESTHDINFSYSDEVVDLVRSRCTEMDSGGRMIDSILTNTLLPEISNRYLTSVIKKETISAIDIGVSNNDFSYTFTP